MPRVLLLAQGQVSRLGLGWDEAQQGFANLEARATSATQAATKIGNRLQVRGGVRLRRLQKRSQGCQQAGGNTRQGMWDVQPSLSSDAVPLFDCRLPIQQPHSQPAYTSTLALIQILAHPTHPPTPPACPPACRAHGRRAPTSTAHARWT